LINYNLTGKALLHCLKLSGANLILVDNDETLGNRIDEVKGVIEEELKMKIVVANETVMEEIRSKSNTRIEDIYREGVKGNWPMCMLYTSGTTGMPKESHLLRTGSGFLQLR
jgi:acyl-coenzyme A synthetase/AMP-(fatty) acid ligase